MIHRTAEEGYVPCGCDDINNPLTWGEINVHEYYSQPYSAQTLGGIALLLIASTLILGRRKVKVKKRLVFTPRVIRMCISAGIFYAALFIGFYFLVAFFIEQYNDSVIWLVGLAPLFIPFSLLLPIIANIINSPIEKLNNLRYINDAKRIIDNHKNLITIGITGSYGKTSTKFFLHKLLSVKYNTLMTPESFNTTLGVVKTIRNDLKATHEIFICEMGLKWLGDIKEICEIVKPRHSILTSIGPQHLETMKTLDNIINEKFEIVNAINTDDGMVFLNYDNEHIASRKVEKNIVRYGLTAGNKDYCASDISVSEKGTAFTVNGVRFETRLLGAHNVQNITGAIACANRLGIELKDLVLPVKRLEPVPHRLQIINKGTDIIIDDAFNSNPVGASSALDVLKAFNGLRILVTPGMVELGEKEFELNKSFGFHAGECCDYAVLIGEKQAVPIKAGLLENNFPDEKIHVFKTLNEGLEFVYKIDSEQKVILLENDLPDNY
ncbi:MAG: UDP-N-acetylmuramoyl-tripeptide--D-alanyl-D-alanine ligase [Oscillospiraceae bacterium]|nr:UDP-N-acetylmuramoyl-tripeptide--D-alanyl-D-alanine ligase [Oscillospiraceae bacterium]